MGKELLILEEVSKSFGGVNAVDGVWLGFETGKITGLIGPNGAGKTTLFNLISGFIKPDDGKIMLGDQEITGLNPWTIAQMGIGRLFQDIRVFAKMTALDNVLAAFKKQPGESALYSLLARAKMLKQERNLLAKALELLDFVGLADKRNDYAEDLSYGQQKLLSIARLLAAEADILLLDEPTAGVNPAMIRNILDVLRTLAQRGKTIVIIEHNMNIILEATDWAVFMMDGRIVLMGTPDDVLGDPEIRAAYVGLSGGAVNGAA